MANAKRKNKNKTRTGTKATARSGARSGTGKRVASKPAAQEGQTRKPGTVSRRRPGVERKREGESV